MKQNMIHVGLYVILPLLFTAFFLLFLGEAQALEFEEPLHVARNIKIGSGEEPPIVPTPVIGIER